MSPVDSASVLLLPAPPAAMAVRGVVRTVPGGTMGQRAEAGEAAFAEFAGSRGPALVRLARGLLRDPFQAEDVVQDVLAKALVQWGRVSSADDPDAYVRRMVVNACTSWFRRAARREFVHDASTFPERPQADPSDGVDERDRMVALLRRLPTKQRAVLVLRHYEGLPDAEIARLLGSSDVSVRTNAHRGLATLRRLMSETADGPAGPGGEEEVSRR